LAIAGALLLVGCGDTDLMTVRFQNAVGSAGQQVNPDLSQMLNQALEQRQVDPENLRFRVDRKDKHLLHVSSEGPLDPRQLSALQDLFDEIVLARSLATMDIEVTLQPTATQREDLTPAQAAVVNAMPPTFTVQADLADMVSTVAMMPQAWPVPMMDLSLYVMAEVKCQLPVNPRIYPRMGSPIEIKRGKSRQELIVVFLLPDETDGPSYWRVSARYRFKDVDLQRKVENGEVELLTDNDQALPIAFKLADLGKHRLMSAYRFDDRSNTLIDKCDEAQKKLGRPFSFFVGLGLDRVEAVTYASKTEAAFSSPSPPNAPQLPAAPDPAPH
jgi:hypothetical protein